MTVRLNALQERILLELSGRGNQVKVSVRDLCDSIEIDYADFEGAVRDLYYGDMIAYGYNVGDSKNPLYSITWVGEEWLAKRPDRSAEPRPKRRWFGLARRALNGDPR